MAEARKLEGHGLVLLVLTEDEAQMLRDVSVKTGGSPYDTRRGLMDRVGNALGVVGIEPPREVKDITASLWFGSKEAPTLTPEPPETPKPVCDHCGKAVTPRDTGNESGRLEWSHVDSGKWYCEGGQASVKGSTFVPEGYHG